MHQLAFDLRNLFAKLFNTFDFVSHFRRPRAPFLGSRSAHV
jgi:hypothetical protein